MHRSSAKFLQLLLKALPVRFGRASHSYYSLALKAKPCPIVSQVVFFSLVILHLIFSG